MRIVNEFTADTIPPPTLPEPAYQRMWHGIEEQIRLYLEIMEQDPRGLDFLNERMVQFGEDEKNT